MNLSIERRTNEKKKNWGIIVGVILGIASIATSFFPSYINITQGTFLLSIFAFFHDLYSKTNSSLESTQKHSSEMSINVKNRLQVFKSDYSAVETFDKYVINRLDVIKCVKNTSFNLANDHHIADENFNKTEELFEAPKRISHHVNNGLKWKDIGDGYAQERFRCWADKCKSKFGKGEYEYVIINNRVPYPNFLIITYKDDREEVLFNWDFRSDGYKPRVLISNAPELIFFYNQQFDLLWKNATIDSDLL